MIGGFNPHRLAVRVYYEDTDFSGVVYHASYLRFLERGRTEFLRDLGITQSALATASPAPVTFAVRHMVLDFLGSARMDDALTVETEVTAVSGASITMRQAVKRDARELVTAVVRIACVSDGRARRIPPALAPAIRQTLVPARLSQG